MHSKRARRRRFWPRCPPRCPAPALRWPRRSFRTAKASTTSRKALQLKVEKSLIKIVTTAELVFEDRPEVLALFRSALPSSRSRKPRDKQPDEKPTP
ncbi:MAG TPA: hypothetical protein DFS52_02430 [Myxococcales bacterium]|nr:hypothetical protein [Myxococcales bacterium]